MHSEPARQRDWGLLLSLILIWAISWSVIKIGVSGIPPIWYGCLRYAIAAVCFFAFIAMRREWSFPPRSDWPLIAVSGLLQMAAYSALTGLALTVLPPGRASVLAYSTPIWVAPLAAWRLHERMTPYATAGVAIGFLGILTIASPSLGAADSSQIPAYALLMGAALAWAISIVFIRGHRFTASAADLAPWSMLVAGGALLPLALVIEGPPPPINSTGALSLAYVGPVATAFAYWAVVEAGRRFHARTISMALLATPGVGILISALTLGETVDLPLAAGIALTATGIRLAIAAR